MHIATLKFKMGIGIFALLIVLFMIALLVIKQHPSNDASEIVSNLFQLPTVHIVKSENVLVKNLSVRKIVVDGINIRCGNKINSYIHSFTILINNKNNIVYAVYSPKPVSNGNKDLFWAHGSSFRGKST